MGSLPWAPVAEDNAKLHGKTKNVVICAFFRIFATGSDRKYLPTSKFNPAQREHSIEGCNFSVALVEVDFLKISLNRAYYATCATWRDLNLRANSKKIAFFQTTILGTTLEKLGLWSENFAKIPRTLTHTELWQIRVKEKVVAYVKMKSPIFYPRLAAPLEEAINEREV